MKFIAGKREFFRLYDQRPNHDRYAMNLPPRMVRMERSFSSLKDDIPFPIINTYRGRDLRYNSDRNPHLYIQVFWIGQPIPCWLAIMPNQLTFMEEIEWEFDVRIPEIIAAIKRDSKLVPQSL